MHATPAAFVPPHCPRTTCRYHVCTAGWRWIRYGSYRRRAAPRDIQRFRCVHCRLTFSTQTFAASYYLKRPALLFACAHRLLACSGCRQIAREARCAHSTVVALAARLGRLALLALYERRPRSPCCEPLVVDGFEGFAFSQYQPLHLNLVVGAQSHYVYAFTLSHLRRKGRMRAAQRRRRARLEALHGRPEPRAIELGVAAALRLAVPVPQPLTLRSDEHPAYPRALRRLHGYRLCHECTPSRQARTAGNPLFAVNRCDLQLRHNSANHKRETIAFSKRHQAVIERAALLFYWLDYQKPFSENHDGGTPAMRLGLSQQRESFHTLLGRRRFPSRVVLPEPWAQYYRRAIDTPGIRNPRRHELKRAF